ncbi:progestin and adipoQ receptor family member 4-like isoform X1 [Limulus polyphemus]|uniref:Progestin and adipoQ receptor family member 4-like isoform X1 n=1 Tax=Limulus polyphemus TaxID=6850 RepID=A0ABM1S858_LIMPO|nr:progestin and adipoQ receptor family member 4-like isoform X1 [Limulus polyphemus]
MYRSTKNVNLGFENKNETARENGFEYSDVLRNGFSDIPSTDLVSTNIDSESLDGDSKCKNKSKNVNFKGIEILNNHRLLLRRDQVPVHLQFNPYVIQGYRPILTTWGCLQSLFYLHNETINIFTHALALVYALIWLPYLLPWDQIQIPILPYCHAVATFAPWLGSSTYHLFMNHEGGSKTYVKLLQWDMIGIWVTQTCGAFTTLYAGMACLPLFIRYGVMFVYLLFSVKALCAATFASSAWQRRISFLYLLLMRLAVLCVRLTKFGGGHPQALVHVAMQDLWSVIGAVISATQIPERWLPGKFDMAFNSHNIMHALVVLGSMHMHWAAEKDFIWLSEEICNP